MDNLYVGALTAGTLIVTILVTCYALLWQGIKDWETGIVLLVVSLGVLALVDPFVLDWLPFLVLAGSSPSSELCDQLARWKRALMLGVYSLPFFALFCTLRVAEADWWAAQWIRRLFLIGSPRRVMEEKMMAFNKSRTARVIVRLVFLGTTVLYLHQIAGAVHPAGCATNV